MGTVFGPFVFHMNRISTSRMPARTFTVRHNEKNELICPGTPVMLLKLQKLTDVVS